MPVTSVTKRVLIDVVNGEIVKLPEEFQMCSNDFDIDRQKTQLNMLQILSQSDTQLLLLHTKQITMRYDF